MNLTQRCSLLFVFIFFFLYSNNIFAIGTIYLQNNTPEKFTLEITQSGNYSLNKGSYWNTSGSSTLKAGEKNRRILWYNRNEGIKNGKTYYFDTHLKTSSGETLITLEQKLTGTWRFSNFWYSVRGNEIETSWQTTRDVRDKTFTFNGEEYIIKYRAHYNAGTASDDVTYVIHKVTPYSIHSTETEAEQLNVLSYNIYTVATRTVSDINNRLRALPEALTGYDVIIFSEAFYNPAREELIQNLYHEYPYSTNTVGTNSPALEDGGVIIVSRYPITLENQIVYQDCSGSDCLAAKGVMYVKIDKYGKTYHIFGTHTQAWPDQTSQSVRKNQFTELRSFIDSKALPTNEPVIIGGDLNVDKASYPDEYATMLTILNASEPVKASYGYTYTTDESTNNLANGHEYLDYVLYSNTHQQPTESSNASLIFKSIDNSLWGTWDFSDHYPNYGFFNFENY